MRVCVRCLLYGLFLLSFAFCVRLNFRSIFTFSACVFLLLLLLFLLLLLLLLALLLLPFACYGWFGFWLLRFRVFGVSPRAAK